MVAASPPTQVVAGKGRLSAAEGGGHRALRAVCVGVGPRLLGPERSRRPAEASQSSSGKPGQGPLRTAVWLLALLP